MYRFLLELRDYNTGRQTNKVSALHFYSYRPMVRKVKYTLIYFKQLMDQCIVDMYNEIETKSLMFVCINQTKLRTKTTGYISRTR